MKIHTIDANVTCSKCKEDAIRLHYLNDELQRIECLSCGHWYSLGKDVNLYKEFANEVYSRILTKPIRLKEEFKDNKLKALPGLPIRFAKMPFKMKDYIIDTTTAFRKGKDLK